MLFRLEQLVFQEKKVKKGRIEGFKNGYKKAIIKVKEGQKIEMILQ